MKCYYCSSPLMIHKHITTKYCKQCPVEVRHYYWGNKLSCLQFNVPQFKSPPITITYYLIPENYQHNFKYRLNIPRGNLMSFDYDLYLTPTNAQNKLKTILTFQ